MKVVVMMWILFLTELSSEKRVYDGTLNECLLNAILYNENHKDESRAGCYMEVVQFDFVPRE